MTTPDLTFWSNDDGSFTVARLSDQLELGRYRDDDQDGWRAWFGTDTASLQFLGEYEDDGDAFAAIADAARDAGLA